MLIKSDVNIHIKYFLEWLLKLNEYKKKEIVTETSRELNIWLAKRPDRNKYEMFSLQGYIGQTDCRDFYYKDQLTKYRNRISWNENCLPPSTKKVRMN